MNKILKTSLTFLAGIVIGVPLVAYALSGANGTLDLTGTPMLSSKSNADLVLNLPGSGTLVLNMASGTARVPISNPAAGTAATTVATSGTIDTTQFWQRITNAGAITGVIMEAGAVHGQLALISVDKDASGTTTMAAEATSNVCAGVTVVIAAGENALFVWDATDTCWAGWAT